MLTRLRLPLPALALSLLASLLVPNLASGAATSCDLPVGTAGIPGVAVSGTTGFDLLPLAPASARLPRRVLYRDTTTTFNRLWAFSLAAGHVYARSMTQASTWRQMRIPACLDGHVTGISADNAVLMATDSTGRIYTMDQALSAPMVWNWTSRWGPPLWVGQAGATLPPYTRDWSASMLSLNDDKTWTDAAGNAEPVGGGNVTTLFALTGDGSRIVYLDPWLPPDNSYQVQTPLNGRFRAIAIAASASTIFVIDKYGDMYTRLRDFDMSGADTTFFRYSYENQRGRTSAPNWEVQLLGTQYAAFQLPAVGWAHQPKIPGQITGHISIQTTGPGSASRELRVEGKRAGQNGYWHKAIGANTWQFTAVGQPLSQPLIQNPPNDYSAVGVAPGSGLSYAGSTARYSTRVTGFTTATERSMLTLRFGDGSRLPLTLYTVDALRQTARSATINADPWVYDGEIEVPTSVIANLSRQSADVQQFVRTVLGSKRFTASSVTVTLNDFKIAALSLDLRR